MQATWRPVTLGTACHALSRRWATPARSGAASSSSPTCSPTAQATIGPAVVEPSAPSAKIEDLHAALDFIAKRPDIDDDRLAVLGVCAGAGYAAGVVATDPRVRAFGAVAGFFHDAAQQRLWMGERFDHVLAEAAAAKQRYAETDVAEIIPAVGNGHGPVAMPLAEAYEYYGTPRGAVPNYVNAFAIMSRADTLPYDAQGYAARIQAPTILVHSEHALAPALARKFFDALGGRRQIEWVESKGQIDFYDEPSLIGVAADLVAEFFREALASSRASSR